MAERLIPQLREAIRNVFGDLPELLDAQPFAPGELTKEDQQLLIAVPLEGMLTERQAELVNRIDALHSKVTVADFNPFYPYVHFAVSTDLFASVGEDNTSFESVASTEYVRRNGVLVQRDRVYLNGEQVAIPVQYWRSDESKVYEIPDTNKGLDSGEVVIRKTAHKGASPNIPISAHVQFDATPVRRLYMAGETIGDPSKFAQLYKQGLDRQVIIPILSGIEFSLDKTTDTVMVHHGRTRDDGRFTMRYNTERQIDQTPLSIQIKRTNGIIKVTRANALTGVVWTLDVFDEYTHDAIAQTLNGDKDLWSVTEEKYPVSLTING